MSKGSTDTSGIRQAAATSDALQKQMYEESIARGKPFYDVGAGGISKLGDYLGIDTAPSRASIYEELSPQYTSQTPSGLTGTYIKDGVVRTGADLLHPSAGGTNVNAFTPTGSQTTEDLFRDLGYKQLTAGTAPEVDYDALNQAVDTQFAEGQERPDYYGSLLESYSPEKFYEDPSYQFRLAEGEKALARSSAARGQTFSPRAAKELQEYGQGLASQEYAQAYDRYNIDQTNIYNRLAGIAGMGQQQAQQATGAGQQYAGQVGQTQASLADAIASAKQSDRSAKQSMFNTLVGAGAAFATGGASIPFTTAASSGKQAYTPQMLFKKY